MGNSMSLQGHPAPVNSSAPHAEPLHGPARLPLELKHAKSAHAAAAAEAPTTIANITTSSGNPTTSTPTAKQETVTPQQAGSEQGRVRHNPKPAASLSSSSSAVSLSSRGFANDDTMPWRGSPHGSHGSLPDLEDAKSDTKSDKSDGHGELHTR
jgi:hypothetical protein